MRFIPVRETRNNPAEFRKALEQDDVVLTAGGKPFAIAIGVTEDDMEETLDLIRRVRALRALNRLQRDSADTGAADVSGDDIDEEIRKVRRGRRRSA